MQFISIAFSSHEIGRNGCEFCSRSFFFLKNEFCFYFYFSAIKVLLLLCSYFLDNAERICNTNYVPTVKDILHARLKTTGASELNFEVKQHKFHVIDVGGQRCQRTQWYVNSLVPRSLIPSSLILSSSVASQPPLLHSKSIFRISSSAFFPFTREKKATFIF